MFPYFVIFGKTVGSYALLAMAGLLVCGFAAYRLGKQRGTGAEDIVLLMVSVGIGLFVGGHILYGITNIYGVVRLLSDRSFSSVSDLFSQLLTCFGGMVFYGGFIGAFGAVCLHTRFSKDIDRRDALDILAVATPLFHTFGRIGCFLGGCCYGVESSWGVLITNNTLSPDINGVVRLPIQLIEAGCNLLIFLAVLSVYRKGRLVGRLIYLYILCYAPTRFVLEFYRGDAIRGIWFGLSTSQWISLLLMLLVVIKGVVARHKGSPGAKASV